LCRRRRAEAVNALLAKVCKYVVVWRAMHNPRGTYQNLPSCMAAGAYVALSL
jgi:hypothetical protein